MVLLDLGIPNLLEMNFMGWFSSQFGGLEEILDSGPSVDH